MAAAIGIAKTATEIFLGVGEISIDNLTFKLFYKWSVTLFIVSSVLVCTSQFFGEPIQCETVRNKLGSVYIVTPLIERTVFSKRVKKSIIIKQEAQLIGTYIKSFWPLCAISKN